MATVTTAFFHAPRLLHARGIAAPPSRPGSTCSPTLTTRGLLTPMARGSSDAINNDDNPINKKRHRTPSSQQPSHRQRPRTDDAEDMRRFYTIDQRANVVDACRVASLSATNLEKYLHHSPIPRHTREAFDVFRRWRNRPGARPQLCLDAGCGQAWSSLKLARQLPQCDVVGIDKSEVRLTRNKAFRDEAGLPQQDGNVLLLQADLVPFWRLCWEHGIYPTYQFILYPNPYPKASDMKRRIHGHPIFPILVALGGRVEVRASWVGYLKEFRQAYATARGHLGDIRALQRRLWAAGGAAGDDDSGGADLCVAAAVDRAAVSSADDIGAIEQLTVSEPLSNFEAKYVGVRLPLHRLVIDDGCNKRSRGEPDDVPSKMAHL